MLISKDKLIKKCKEQEKTIRQYERYVFHLEEELDRLRKVIKKQSIREEVLKAKILKRFIGQLKSRYYNRRTGLISVFPSDLNKLKNENW